MYPAQNVWRYLSQHSPKTSGGIWALLHKAKPAFKKIRDEYIKETLDAFKDGPEKFWQELSNVIPGKKASNSDILNLLAENTE